MKNLVLIALFISTSVGTSAQLVFGSIGYNANWTQLDGLNQVVDDYNNTRDFLDKEMNQFRNLDGPIIGLGMGSENWLFTMEFGWARLKRSAEGVDISGLLQQRQVRVSHNVFSMSNYFGIFEEQGGVGLGLRMAVGRYKTKTRVFPKSESAPDWEKIDKQLTANAGPAIRIIIGDGVYSSIDIYYTWSLIATSENNLNGALTGPDHFDIDALDNPMALFGFSWQIAFGEGG